jgi:sarcosine oxidase delta subunit
MNNTWVHLCNNELKDISWNNACPICGTSQVEESLRHQGAAAIIKNKNLFAKLKEYVLGRKNKKTNDEHQDAYHDRNG